MPVLLAPNLYQLEVLLPGSPLKILNSYLVVGKNRNLLIDTGFRTAFCKESLLGELAATGCSLADTDIYLTHLHSDHAGLAPEIIAPGRHIYISRMDGQRLIKLLNPDFWAQSDEEILREGWPLHLLDELRKSDPGRLHKGLPFKDYSFVEENDILTVGENGPKLRVIATPGHTPGHTCLYWEDAQIMFLGDHVLYSISPNITRWYQHNNSLREYLHSLEKIRQYPVKMALAAHRNSIGNLDERASDLLQHHEERLSELYSLVCQYPGINCFDVGGYMHWRIRCNSWADFPLTQKWFAVGEVVAHMQELQLRGLVEPRLCEGVNGYFCCEK